MKRIISYCLYGALPMYLIGALKNAEQVQTFYPGWVARFYVGKSVPEDIVAALVERKAEIVREDGPENAAAMLWRFQPIFDQDIEVFVSRDCDSRLSEREAAAVDAWLNSGKPFHIMRDHPYHDAPIMGGMWGLRGQELCARLQGLLHAFEPGAQKGTDQLFLGRHVYPLVRKESFIHDSFFRYEWWARFFPLARANLSFVGDALDEHDCSISGSHETLEYFNKHPLQRFNLFWKSRKGFGEIWFA